MTSSTWELGGISGDSRDENIFPDALTPVKSLELVSEGKALFPNKTLARQALAIAPPIGYDIELYDPSDDMQSALLALASLVADVQSQTQKTSIVQHLFFSENKKDWNLIYPWLDFFADVCLETMASTCKSFELQDHVLYIFPLLFLGPLYGHLRHPSLVRETLLLLKSTLRIMKNIFHAWSFASDSAHQTLILHSQTLLLFSDAANAIKITTSDNVNMSLFTDAFFTLPSGPILPFMSFLDQHVSKLMPGIMFHVIEVLVTSLKSIVCDLDLQCFLDAGALRSLINALQRLSTPKSLIVLLIYQKGVPALAEALDLGWLKTIYQTAYFVERERQIVRMEKLYFGGPLSEYLANMVTFFSVPSLMQYCVKFTNAMLSHRPDAFEFPRAPKFEAVWKALIERVNQMDSLRRAYKNDMVICANGKCITTLEQDRFIRDQNESSPVMSPLSPFGNNYDTGFYSYAAKQILHKHSRSILKCLFSDSLEEGLVGFKSQKID
ncbi:hypothetical protein F5880DRAFT_1688726 [Lentinula raphanica]|nr:hypothetical protein F5880DRAFT_1688726 [Lentinula raphanica]